MFWRAIVNSEYSERPAMGLHVSQAALDVSTLVDDKDSVQLFVRFNRENTLIATLNRYTAQTQLGLAFDARKKIKFVVRGTGTVHLAGFFIPDENFDETQPNGQNNAVGEIENDLEHESNELANGVVVRDVLVGRGRKVAKKGNKLTVYFENRTELDGEVVTKMVEGESSGLEFELGSDDVIQGWNIGILGMKAGGKRVIISPPNEAYGEDGIESLIPANATIYSTIQLKSIK